MKQDDGFEEEKARSIERMNADAQFRRRSRDWLGDSARLRYSYHFSWLGRPIIQIPQDMVAMQEIVWEVGPRLIVETGIARGGSLVFLASLLELLGGDGRVLGIDVDIREHNRREIDRHALRRRIDMIEGSSVDPAVVDQVRRAAADRDPVMVILDSNHTHEHVLRELELYSPLVTLGSYLVVFDTVIEELPADARPDRPWGPGDNPLTALREFLARNDRFEVDHVIDAKLQVSMARGGYLRCVKGPDDGA